MVLVLTEGTMTPSTRQRATTVAFAFLLFTNAFTVEGFFAASSSGRLPFELSVKQTRRRGSTSAVAMRFSTQGQGGASSREEGKKRTPQEIAGS